MSESINGSEPALDTSSSYGSIGQDSTMSDGDVGEFEATQRLYHDLYFLGRINNKVINDSIKPLLRNFVENEDDLNQVFQCLDTLTTTNEGLLDYWTSSELLNNPTKSDLIAEASSRANTLSAQLSQHTSATNIMDESRLAFSSASPSLQHEQAISFIDSSSEATASRVNNDWQSEHKPTQQRGKKRKRVPKSSSTAAVTSFDVDSFKMTAVAEVETFTAQFDTINFGKSDTDTSNLNPMPIVVDLVKMCHVQLVQEFNREEPNLASIDRICNNFRRIIEGVDIFREELVCSEKEKLAVLESVPSYSRFTLDKLLTSLSQTEKVNISGTIDNAYITSATRAIEALLGQKVTPKALEKFAVHQQSVKSTLNIVGHISVIIRVLAKFTVDEVFSRHDDYNKLIAELHLDRYGNEIDTTEFTALQLHELGMYYLKNDEYESWRDKIRGLLLATKEGVLRSDQAKEKFNAVALEGSVGVTSGFFSDSTSIRDAWIPFILLSLADDVEAMAASGLFEEYGGFNLRVLDLSWRDIKHFCRNLVDADFFAPHTPKAKSGRKMLESLAEKKKKKQEKTSLIIYSKQQMNSLQALCQFD